MTNLLLLTVMQTLSLVWERRSPYLTSDIALWPFLVCTEVTDIDWHGYLTILAKQVFFYLFRPWNRMRLQLFTNTRCFSTPLSCLTSIVAIDPVCPQVIFPIRVTLFPFGLPHVTNIGLRFHRHPSPSFCSELNGVYADETEMSLLMIFFFTEEMGLKSWKIARFAKCCIHPLITGSNVDIR